MIWIRADASREIGAGHVMRCLSIAHALKQCGRQVCFLLADEGGAPLLEKAGQEYRILHSDYRNMEGELFELRSLFAENASEFFLADSYFVTDRYLREIRQKVPAGILDDMASADLSADLLINYNIYADASLYGKGAACGGYLLGTDYVPLRSEFEEVTYHVRKKAETVLITTGGSDKYNLAGQLLKKALADSRTSSLRYLVVSGAYNTYLAELRAIESRCGNVRVCCNAGNMAELMRGSDIAVSAAGSTMYELSAVGVPVICLSFVDNQERIVRGFVEKGLAGFGGSYLSRGEAVLDEAVCHIDRLAADYDLRREFHGRLRKVVDGKGAMRIAGKLCGYGF